MKASVLFLFLLLSAGLSAQTALRFNQLAAEQIRRGESIRALEYLNLAIRKEPSNPESFYLRGYAKYTLDDYMGAELDYSRSIDLSPYLADVFTSRAIVRSQMENYQGAMEDFGRAAEMNPGNGEILYHRARTNLAQKKFYSAIVDCNRAIELKFRNEGVYILRSGAKAELKRYEEALHDLDTALMISPKNGYVFSQRGLVRMELGSTDSAILDFGEAVRLDSVSTYARFNRAIAWLKISRQDSALADLNAVIALSPYNSYAYYNRAVVRIGMKDLRGAIADLEIVSRLDPKNIVSYFYRSKLRTEIKDYPGALADLDKTLELLPDYTDAWFDRYELKLKMNDRKGAMSDYSRAMELVKKNHLNPDSLHSERKDYLKNLVKLSGDFEQMNAMSSKLQNQAVDIRPRPMYRLVIWKTEFDRVSLLDVYRRPHYPSNILSLTNQEQVVPDSVLWQEAERQTEVIDSAGPLPGALSRRAITMFHLHHYEAAWKDLSHLVLLDSNDLTAWFTRAGVRYELIGQLTAREEATPAITLGMAGSRVAEPARKSEVEHTFDQVILDYDRALRLDPDFAFGWYNRGFVNSRMGNYREAIDDLSKALALRPDLTDGWYNRGLLYILLQENHSGCSDLSRAGELGITDAYRVMKRYCYK